MTPHNGPDRPTPLVPGHKTELAGPSAPSLSSWQPGLPPKPHSRLEGKLHPGWKVTVLFSGLLSVSVMWWSQLCLCTLPTLPSPSPTFLTRFEIGVPEAIWMDLEIIIPSEVSQKEKDKYHTLFLICGIQNVTQMKLSAEQKQAHREQTCGCQSGGRKGRDGLRVWEQQVQTVMLRMDNSKVLLNSTGNCTQSLGVNHNGKAHKEECMYV